MWVLLATLSALCLGFYDVMKKLSVERNSVLGVLFLNTLFGAMLMCPVIIIGLAHGNYGLGNTLEGHGAILLKSFIVLSSWLLGYASIKHLPLTIAGPVNASRPVLVLVGALAILGRRPPRILVALLHKPRRQPRGLLVQTQPLALDGHRCHRPRSRQRPL